MTFMGNDASGGGGMFPQHPKVGNWETLKGSMLAPHLQMPMMSTAMGDSRHQALAPAITPTSTIIVNTPLTPGGGTMAH